MLSHIASDLHQAYLEEVFKPKLGKPGASTPAKPTSPSDLDGDGDTDSFEKKVRQFIYDVRHLMRKQNIPVERAFQMRSAKTNYGAEVIKTAKEKLGIKSGSVTPVSEESSERMVKVTINYKNGTIDRRNVPYSEISTLRAKPTISSVEVSSNKVSYPAGEKYEKKYGSGGKNTVGDRDGDGTIEPDRHEYAGVKDNAIKKAMFRNKSVSKKRKLKSYGVSEGFSNWRKDLNEVMNGVNDEIASRNQRQVKEREVNNYEGGKDAVVKINPEVTEQTILSGYIVESFELDESYIEQVIDVATEFFHNCGLNENGVDIVIEELGEEKFNEFIFDLTEEYFLSEELKKSESKVKTSKAPKGTKQYATTIARVKKQGGTQTQMQSSGSSGTIKKKDIGKKITADKTKEAVEKAKETQAPSSKKSAEGTKKEVKKGILGHLKQSWQTAREVGREHERRVTNAAATVAGAVAGARKFGKKVEQSPEATRARRKATVAVGRGAQAAGKAAIKAAGAAGAAVGSGVAARRRGASAAGTAGAALGAGVRKLTKEELELQEKAESEQQQKLFGLALSVKRGETPRSEASPEVLKIVDSMSEKKIRDFAKTPHSEVPKKKIDEAISNPEGVTDTKSPLITRIQKKVADKQVQNAQAKLGEDIDSLETSNPKIADINKRIASLEVMYTKKKDPNTKRKILSLNLQKQRLEAQEAKERLKNPNQNQQKTQEKETQI